MMTHIKKEITNTSSKNKATILRSVVAGSRAAEVNAVAVKSPGVIDGPTIIKTLVPTLTHHDEATRNAALRALLKRPDTLEVLSAMLEDRDRNIRQAATKAFLHLVKNKPPMLPRPKNKKTDNSFPVKIGFFFLGVVFWSVPAIFIALIKTIHPAEVVKGGLVLCIIAMVSALILVAMKGWNRKFLNHRPGSYDPFYKFIIIFLISVSVIGMAWVLFWTGRGVLRFWHGVTERK